MTKKRTCSHHPTKEARFMIGLVYLCAHCAERLRLPGEQPVRLR